MLLSGTVAYFIYRAYILAGVFSDLEEYTKELEDMTQYMYTKISDTHKEMKQIDRLGAFLKDVIDNLEEEFNGKKKEKVK